METWHRGRRTARMAPVFLEEHNMSRSVTCDEGRYVLAAKLHEICNLFHKFRSLKLSYQLIGPGIIKVFAELSNNSTPKLM